MSSWNSYDLEMPPSFYENDAELMDSFQRALTLDSVFPRTTDSLTFHVHVVRSNPVGSERLRQLNRSLETARHEMELGWRHYVNSRDYYEQCIGVVADLQCGYISSVFYAGVLHEPHYSLMSPTHVARAVEPRLVTVETASDVSEEAVYADQNVPPQLSCFDMTHFGNTLETVWNEGSEGSIYSEEEGVLPVPSRRVSVRIQAPMVYLSSYFDLLTHPFIPVCRLRASVPL